MSFDASIPRAELHLHAGGSFPTKDLCKIASAEDAATLRAWQKKVAGRVGYKEVFTIFEIISRIINTNERVEKCTYKLCKAQKRDGVQRLELRSGLKSLDGSEEDYLEALLRGIKRADLCATVVLSVKRDSTSEYVQKTCELALAYRNRGVVGIDISGDSTKGDITLHIETLKKARDAGLFLTVHMGESPDEKDQMLILRELRPHRIDHGVCLDAEAVDWIRRNRIPVTVCPKSSRLCSMHESDESHRWALEHLRTGHPIIIGTDDPTVFGTTLTEEYLALETILGVDRLHALAKDSFKYAFRPLPEGFLPFAEFSQKFMLAETSTEKSHPLTKKLSEVIQRNVGEGMELLLQVDELVLGGFSSFIETIDRHAKNIADNIQAGGTIYLIGSGSSGRVSVDIAARCIAAFPGARIEGLVSGGDSAMIRPKEGFEDSFANGRRALNLKATDMVFVLSASGSATFNEGCADKALECKANVYYFYNSEIVPDRTQKLFDRGVEKLCVDIGPQAVAGSTRLQAATLAQCCLGSLLASAFYKSVGNDEAAAAYPTTLLANMKQALNHIRSNIGPLSQLAEVEHSVFANPNSNFRRLRDDPAGSGYVTMLAMKDSMREVLIDSTESSPTFSTNPIRRESESNKKRAEFRAYMVGEKNNYDAWSDLLGREVKDRVDVDSFVLSAHADAVQSYKDRPKGHGNFVLAVAKITDKVPSELLDALDEASGSRGLFLLCNGAFNQEEASKLRNRFGYVVVMEHVPTDALGLSESILLKQALNLVSNTSMALMHKLHGNLMIDVRASNEKLKGRCVRLVEEIIKGTKSQEEIYHSLAHVYVAMQKATQEGTYVPSIVKILAQMYAKNLTPDDFDQVVEILRANQEQLSL